MDLRRSLLTSAALCQIFFLTGTGALKAQTAPLMLKASVVLTPEFCATKFKEGNWVSGKETFEVGKAACVNLEPALKGVFSSLSVVSSRPSPGDSQLVLVPRFVDAGATKTVLAFSNREMDVFLEWTVTDDSGKRIWFETVKGSAKHHSGNMFTHNKDLKAIVADSVKDAAAQSARQMSSSPELRKLTL